MKKIIYSAILILACMASYYVGSHDIYMAKDCNPDGSESIWYPHSYSLRESLKFEREYANALFEGLHRWYSNDDNDMWFESFMHTKEYAKIDSLNQGDWEDFYYYESAPLESWYDYYGVLEEPSQTYKDTVSTKYIELCKTTNSLR